MLAARRVSLCYAQTDHFNEYEEDDGDPPPVYNDASNAPRIVGLDQCAAFRAATTGKRRPAPAGLFNTGTNFFAKYGSEHRMSLADAPGRKNSRRKYANETRRYGTLTGGDLEAIRRDIDPRLLDAFRYAFSDARRREVVGRDAACSAASSSWWRGH